MSRTSAHTRAKATWLSFKNGPSPSASKAHTGRANPDTSGGWWPFCSCLEPHSTTGQEPCGPRPSQGASPQRLHWGHSVARRVRARAGSLCGNKALPNHNRTQAAAGLLPPRALQTIPTEAPTRLQRKPQWLLARQPPAQLPGRQPHLVCSRAVRRASLCGGGTGQRLARHVPCTHTVNGALHARQNLARRCAGKKSLPCCRSPVAPRAVTLAVRMQPTAEGESYWYACARLCSRSPACFRRALGAYL